MPIRYQPDYNTHIAYITGEGCVNFDDCVQLIKAQGKDVSRRLHELNDYRGIELDLAANEVEELADLNRELYANIKDIRFAVVVDTGLGTACPVCLTCIWITPWNLRSLRITTKR